MDLDEFLGDTRPLSVSDGRVPSPESIKPLHGNVRDFDDRVTLLGNSYIDVFVKTWKIIAGNDVIQNGISVDVRLSNMHETTRVVRRQSHSRALRFWTQDFPLTKGPYELDKFDPEKTAAEICEYYRQLTGKPFDADIVQKLSNIIAEGIYS